MISRLIQRIEKLSQQNKFIFDSQLITNFIKFNDLFIYLLMIGNVANLVLFNFLE